MKLKKIWNNIDKKRFKMVFSIIIFFLVGVAIINIIGVTYSKYESSALMETSAKVAYFIADTTSISDTITLDNLTPRNEPFLYEIYVNNFKDDKKANVNIAYKLNIKTTTNLPLTYKLLYNEDYSQSATDLIDSVNLTQEGDMYFKNITTTGSFTLDYHQNQSDRFIIVVNYPLEYKDHPEYSGVIDLITITIDAEQVV